MDIEGDMVRNKAGEIKKIAKGCRYVGWTRKFIISINETLFVIYVYNIFNIHYYFNYIHYLLFLMCLF